MSLSVWEKTNERTHQRANKRQNESAIYNEWEKECHNLAQLNPTAMYAYNIMCALPIFLECLREQAWLGFIENLWDDRSVINRTKLNDPLFSTLLVI